MLTPSIIIKKGWGLTKLQADGMRVERTCGHVLMEDGAPTYAYVEHPLDGVGCDLCDREARSCSFCPGCNGTGSCEFCSRTGLMQSNLEHKELCVEECSRCHGFAYAQSICSRCYVETFGKEEGWKALAMWASGECMSGPPPNVVTFLSPRIRFELGDDDTMHFVTTVLRKAVGHTFSKTGIVRVFAPVGTTRPVGRRTEEIFVGRRVFPSGLMVEWMWLHGDKAPLPLL